MIQKVFTPVVILIAVLAVLIIGSGVYYLSIKNNLSNQQLPQPVPSPIASQPLPTTNPTADQTISWKTYSENFDWFKKNISVKYPLNWSVVKSTHSGHPNWITLNAPTQNQCINISVSSEGKTITLDDELKNAASQWDSLKPDNTVTSSNSLTISGQPAKIRSVTKDGNNFMDAAVIIGTDPRYQGDKVFLILSSCGTNEKDFFNTVLMSVSSNI